MTLTNKEYNEYLEIHLKLLFYCGKQSDCFSSKTSFAEFKKFDINEKFISREALLNNKNLIDNYISANPDYLPDEQIEILAGFKKSINGRFIILKCLKKHAVFIDVETNKFYAVKALKDSFEDFFLDFPVVITTTILPFNNQIIHDGFMQSSGMYLGPEMTWEFNQKYIKAKVTNEIYLNL